MQVPSDSEEAAPKPARFPLLKMAEVLVLWGGYLALQLSKSRFHTCSVGYFVLFGCQVLCFPMRPLMWLSATPQCCDQSEQSRHTQTLDDPASQRGWTLAC